MVGTFPVEILTNFTSAPCNGLRHPVLPGPGQTLQSSSGRKLAGERSGWQNIRMPEMGQSVSCRWNGCVLLVRNHTLEIIPLRFPAAWMLETLISGFILARLRRFIGRNWSTYVRRWEDVVSQERRRQEYCRVRVQGSSSTDSCPSGQNLPARPWLRGQVSAG